MKAKDKFSNIIHSSQSHIPMDHQYYLALIVNHLPFRLLPLMAVNICGIVL
jgi:hypothetical protein